MAVAFRSVATHTQDSVTSHTCSIPAGVVSGDVLIMGIQAYLNGSPINTPSGWTLVYNHGTTSGGAAQRNFAVYTRIADGTEGSTLTMTSSAAAYTIISIAAYSGGSGIDVTGDQPGGAINTGTTVSVPVVTTTVANDLLVDVIVENGSSGDSVSPGSGWTADHSSPFGATLNAKNFFLSKPQATAGSTGSSTHTISSIGGIFYCNFLIAVKGSAPAAPPVADFTGTPTSGTASLSVAFTDASSNTPTSWAWDFGDGGTSSSQNPTHSYTTSGTYTVALTASNSGGSNTKTRTAYITVGETIVYAAGGGIDIY